MRTTVDIVMGAVVIILAALLSDVAKSDVKPSEPAGSVRFLNHANSAFDAYSSSPTAEQQKWMREHYSRMLTYSPYFDSRLQWYPDAWAYKDAYAIYTSGTVLAAHPEWVLRDATGNPLYITWGCSNGTCPQYAADFGNPEFRANWIREARLTLDRGYRGLFVDDVNLTWRVGDGTGKHVTPYDPRTRAPMTLANWRRYFAEFLEEVRAAFPDVEIAHNAIWFAGGADDPYIKRQISAADYYVLERGATDSGLTGGTGTYGFETFLSFVDAVHGLGTGVVLLDYGKTLQHREYALAAWLLLSEGIDFMASDQLAWTAPDRWWTGYDADLGKAAGRRSSDNGLLRREFECGTVLLNQPGMPRRSVTLASPHRRLDGSQTTSVTLDASSAAVLLKNCERPSAPSGLQVS